MDYKVHYPGAVAKFMVIPGNELAKVVTERKPSSSIKSGRADVIVKVVGDNLVLNVAQGTLERTLWCFLHVIVFGSFVQAAGQIHD